MKDNKVLEFVKELIRCKSITPDDNNCQKIIINKLESLNFKSEIFSKNGVTNLWITHGTGAPLFVFAGHTDVVPPGPLDNWNHDPFNPIEDKGFLYGRGSSDMKSSIAAFVIAAIEFINDYPKHNGTIALLLTSDEEGQAIDGTSYVCDQLNKRNIKIDYCIVGEPTCEKILGDTCKIGRRGSLSAHVMIHGIQGHIAYPQLIENPIHIVAPALLELINTQWDLGNDIFEPTSFQTSNIHAGNGATNVVPGILDLYFNFRFSSENSDYNIKDIVHRILDKYKIKYDIYWQLNAKPFFTKTGSLTNNISKAIEIETGIQTKMSTSGGTSDGRFLCNISKEIVEFGPCNDTIHKINECIKINDLERIKNIYYKTLDLLLS